MKKIFTIVATLFMGATVMQAEDIVMSIQCWTEEDEYFDAGKDCKSGLIKNEDGSYSILDFVNSGAPLVFSFDPVEDEYSDMTFGGFLDTDDTYPYLMVSDDEYMTCKIYEIDGTDEDYLEVFYPYVDNDGYSYVYTFNDEDAEDYGYKYWASICMSGFDADDENTPWYYISFYFNEPTADDTGIGEIVAEKNAPVEFYNLNGMRVNNPENGIFIRKQGNKVTKIAIK